MQIKSNNKLAYLEVIVDKKSQRKRRYTLSEKIHTPILAWQTQPVFSTAEENRKQEMLKMRNYKRKCSSKQTIYKKRRQEEYQSSTN